MTDKQIIIDVRKCKEHGLRNCEGKLIHWCHTYDDHCADFNDCYYKQLKRKEQECEELKKANIHIDNNRAVKADKLKRIEDLIIACSSGYIDEFIQSLLAVLHEPEPCFESKLSKTLAEIRDIATNHQFPVCEYDGFWILQGVKQRILQKISEVEDET